MTRMTRETWRDQVYVLDALEALLEVFLHRFGIP